jgi:predicted dehydrogenase
MTAQKTKIGVVGCGAISGAYFHAKGVFPVLDIAACADLVMEKAQAQAGQFNIPRACTVKELLDDPAIEIVLNLTVPKAHAEVAMAALEAGKHVYGEKPLAVTRDEGRRMLELAGRANLKVGSAPDTFLGMGGQTARKVIDDGWIGRPIAATAFMMGHGHESWHPNPEFYYEAGGGPMFDMGPYYLTALVNLMGPVRRVSGEAKTTFPTRTITSQPKAGKVIPVETPTHLAGTMEFVSGAVATVVMSFDVWGHGHSCLEVYGTEGSMLVPDPNGFGGPVKVMRPGGAWLEVPLTHGHADEGRGKGVADMAMAIRSGRPHRAGGELAYHVLDIMHAFHDSARLGRHVELESTCRRPDPLPMGLPRGVLD